MSYRAWGLQDDVAGEALDAEWQALLAQQAHTLEALLRRVQAAVAAGSPGPPPATRLPRLGAILADTRRVLAQQVHLAQAVGELQALGRSGLAWPADAAQRLQAMADVSATLHANLTAARQALAALGGLALARGGYVALGLCTLALPLVSAVLVWGCRPRLEQALA